ncbi:MAG: hypothetical protein LUE61_09245 [Clostridiales bacterium]|nr:hypothetical protein [Clostridiales bacterium]
MNKILEAIAYSVFDPVQTDPLTKIYKRTDKAHCAYEDVSTLIESLDVSQDVTDQLIDLLDAALEAAREEAFCNGISFGVKMMEEINGKA